MNVEFLPVNQKLGRRDRFWVPCFDQCVDSTGFGNEQPLAYSLNNLNSYVAFQLQSPFKEAIRYNSHCTIKAKEMRKSRKTLFTCSFVRKRYAF